MMAIIESLDRTMKVWKHAALDRDIETLRLEIAELGALLGERIKEKKRLEEELNRGHD